MVEKDYIDIGANTPFKMFNKKLAEVSQKFVKQRIPFDEPCARLEFGDKIEKMEKESERKNGFINDKDLEMDIDKLDLEKYGDASRFMLMEDQEDVIEKFIEGTKTRVVTGHTLSYRCKSRGHGISLFIPQEEYLKRDVKVEKKSNYVGKQQKEE